MKNPDRTNLSQLEKLPNVGKAIAAKFRLIGIEGPRDLVGQNPYELFDRLCIITGQAHDPCLLDTFIAAVHFIDGGEALPWWHFTAQRKRRLADGMNKTLG